MANSAMRQGAEGEMTTYAHVSSNQIEALCKALALPEQQRYRGVQAMLMEPWAQRQVPQLAPYPSRIGDDHSPYEYSLQFSRNQVELRLLLEAQAHVPSLRDNQGAARALNDALVKRYGVDLSRFDQIADLFLPDDPHGPFSLWHAVCFDANASPDFKIYLNPQVNGRNSSELVMRESVTRLGFARVAESVISRVTAAGAEPNYLSLDLAARLGSRVKLYFAHPNATIDDLESIFALAPTHSTGDVAGFCRAVLGRDALRFDRKPVCYCFSFTEGAAAPVAVTLHLPAAHYCQSDLHIARNVEALMALHDLPVQTYRRALSAVARRPLERGTGLQSYTSYRREPSGLKLTVYLSPELFSTPLDSTSPAFGEAQRSGGE